MNKKAQIWIETVLYTIIILAIIALVLSFTLPKINESKETIIIEQSIEAMKNLDRTIRDSAKQNGNVRIIEFSIKVGEIYINASGDESIILSIDNLKNIYSQDGVELEEGGLKIKSSAGINSNKIEIKIDYKNRFNLMYNGVHEDIKLNSASRPYTFSIENANGFINIKEA